MSAHLYVVTGGPGSGKTSLLHTLSSRGIPHMPEAGRAIIRHQTAIGGTALPWEDRAAYAELMLLWDIRNHAEASERNTPVLMDRGVPDIIGYLTLCGLPVPAHMTRAAQHYRYNTRVFLAPFWAQIYTQDTERRQDPVEARETGRVMAATYRDLGYDLVKLPHFDLVARADLLARHISGPRSPFTKATT